MRWVLALAVALMSVVLVSCSGTPGPAPVPVGGVEGTTLEPGTATTPPKPAPGISGTSRPATEPARPQLVGTVVAVVNNDIVTKQEVLDALKPEFARIDADASLSAEGRQTRKGELIEQEGRLQVERLLALQEARKRLNEEQQARIQQDVDYYIKGLIRRVGSVAQLEKELAAEGQTLQSRKTEELERRMVSELWQQELGSQVFVRPAEMQAYYQAHRGDYHQKAAVRIRQIFLSLTASSNAEEARRRGVELLERLRKGEDFAYLAKEYSQGPNAADGGLWPEFVEQGSGGFRPEVEKVAFRTPVKQVSPLIQTEIGYHIIRVEDLRPERQIPFAEVQDKIAETLSRDKLEAKRRDFVETLWKRSYVQVKWK